MTKRRKERGFGGGWHPTTELLLLAVLVFDKLAELYHQSGRA